VELRLTLPQPLDLSQVEAIVLSLKIVAGSGLKVRDAFFCSPGFKKLAIADWLDETDVSAPGQWQRSVIDLTNIRVLDKATPNQAGLYDRHDVTTICLNFHLPPGAADITTTKGAGTSTVAVYRKRTPALSCRGSMLRA
jgi:hypothetical protein